MNTIDIVIEGYATVTDTGWVASGTTTLITHSTSVILSNAKDLKDSSAKPQNDNREIATDSSSPRNDVIRILVDPGANRELLLEKLDERGLTVDNIDYVFLTHLHIDHSLLMGIFPKAKIINYEAITEGDKGSLIEKTIPGTDVEIIKTPGHEYAGASLLVRTKEGIVAVVGDVFWFEGKEQSLDINKPDDFATDFPILIESRKKILDLADLIIPGHGKMMKVK